MILITEECEGRPARVQNLCSKYPEINHPDKCSFENLLQTFWTTESAAYTKKPVIGNIMGYFCLKIHTIHRQLNEYTGMSRRTIRKIKKIHIPPISHAVTPTRRTRLPWVS